MKYLEYYASTIKKTNFMASTFNRYGKQLVKMLSYARFFEVPIFIPREEPSAIWREHVAP